MNNDAPEMRQDREEPYLRTVGRGLGEHVTKEVVLDLEFEGRIKCV